MRDKNKINSQIDKFNSIIRKKEKIYGLFQDLPKDKMFEEIAALLDAGWDHPWSWHGMPEEFLRQAKELWKVN